MRLSVDSRHAGRIRVYSQSAQTQYVQATVKRIENPATEQEQEIDIEPGQPDAIAITPGKFALAGGGNRLVRVIPLAPVQQETAYRIYFQGVRSDADESDTEISEEARAEVGVSLVWGALVHVVPTEASPELRLDGATLHNIGNVRLGLTTIEHCDVAKRCTTHTLDRSVYPAQSQLLPFTATAGQSVRVHYRLSNAGYRSHLMVLQP